jgi:hypothetical protein
MGDDVIELLRRENPVPETPPALPIEVVLRRLDEEPLTAAERSTRRPRSARRVIQALPMALSAIVVVAVATVAITTGVHGRSSRSPGGHGSSGAAKPKSPPRASHHASAAAATTAASSLAKNNSTRLLDEWAACERGHGDPDQADPTVAHEAIYIAVPMGALNGWDPQDATAPCGQYLAAGRSAVAGGQPIDGWGDEGLYVQYANCMRANGYPTFPYPSGVEPDGHLSTNFNGTGIDPNSPAFLNGSANQTCGKQIGAPAWWINNWGPPGSVDVYPAGTSPNNPWPDAPWPSAAKPTIAPGINSDTAQAPPHGGSGNNSPSAAAPPSPRQRR